MQTTTAQLEPQEVPYVNSIFQQPWWLDAVAPQRWSTVEVKNDAEIQARLPYVVLPNSFGLKILTMPKLTQTLGPWLKLSAVKHNRHLAREKDLLTSLIEQLPCHDYFLQSFHYSIKNWLPFYWKNFKQTTLYTYIIQDLTDLDKVYSGFSTSKRGHIKKAEKHVEVRHDLSCKSFYDNHVFTLRKENKKISYSFDMFKRIYNISYKKNMAKIFYAVDSQENTHAAIFTVGDKNSAYYLVSSIDPDFRFSGASSLLIWKALQYYADKTKKFDFEGSMIEGVERSFRDFGAEQVPYFLVTHTSRRMKLLLTGRETIRTLLGRE